MKAPRRGVRVLGRGRSPPQEGDELKAQCQRLDIPHPAHPMARIFDNIDQDLLSALRATMQVSQRADFCVGYLNLRGWQAIDDLVVPWNPASGQRQ